NGFGIPIVNRPMLEVEPPPASANGAFAKNGLRSSFAGANPARLIPAPFRNMGEAAVLARVPVNVSSVPGCAIKSAGIRLMLIAAAGPPVISITKSSTSVTGHDFQILRTTLLLTVTLRET